MQDENLVSTPSSPVLESAQSAAATLVKNTLYFLASSTIVSILSFIFNVFVVRRLGDERYGLYNTALAYAAIFSIIGDLGMTQYVTREIARGRKTADEMFWNVACVRLILAAVATLFITLSAAFIADYEPTMVWGIFLLCLSYFIFAFYGPMQLVLTAHERVDYGSTLNAVNQLFFVLAGTVVLVLGIPFHGLIVASYIGLPISAIIGIRYIRRLKLAKLKFHVTPREWLPILWHSLPFAIITFTIMAATDLDTVILSLNRSPEEVGWYKAAYNLTQRFLFIPMAVVTPLTPQMSRHFGLSKERVHQTFNTVIKFMATVSMPIGVGISVLAEPITRLLYGESYLPSVPVLAILIWTIPLLSLSWICGSLTTASDKEKKAARVYFFAFLLNLSANLYVVPRYGYVGAAITTVATEAAALVMFYMVLHTDFPLTDVKNTIMKPVSAGLLMGLVIFLLRDWNMLMLIPIGAVVYSGTLFLLHPFNEWEWEVIKGFQAKFTGRLRRLRATP
ncbi:MAG: flippase [Chloroflexi bacterium]|nr:flippase [Chloroflexota bacterium]MBP8058248.1 flippase [Chloroflexota bacterium]